MMTSFDLSGSYFGSAFIQCGFAGPFPEWVVDDAPLQTGIARFAKLLLEAPPKAGAVPEGSFLPFAPNPRFVGRRDEKRAIALALHGTATVVIDSKRPEERA